MPTDKPCQTLSFVPAPLPLPANRSPVAHLVRHTAPAAYGSFLQQRKAAAECQGSQTDEDDKGKERQYCHETPARALVGTL